MAQIKILNESCVAKAEGSCKFINEQIENNFKYHQPKADQPEKYEKIRNKAKELAYLIDELCPNSREKSLAMTKKNNNLYRFRW